MTFDAFIEDVKQGYVAGFISGACSGLGRFGGAIIGGAIKGKILAYTGLSSF